MLYGLIGEHLKHSFSKDIHEELSNEKYQLIELAPSEVKDFILSKKYKGLNVTIPYKQTVIPFLDEIDDAALQIGAINTIVNKDNKLIGYNTDYLGFIEMLKYHNINVTNKNVLVLGTGGASKAIEIALIKLKAHKITKVSTHPHDNIISYEEALNLQDTNIIVNTTPVGMYPNNEDLIISLTNFKNLEAVVDIIYNPIKTKLIIEANKLNIKAISGLYMLVAQALYASMYFHNIKIPSERITKIYKRILNEKQNIVLIGMPSSGKSTIANLLSEELKKEVFDTDNLIANQMKINVDEYIKREGIEKFRECEEKIIKEISKKQGIIISTGGGAILKSSNIDSLSQNGIIIFIDRPLPLLTPTKDRPLSSNKVELQKRYEERYNKYLDAADIVIKNDSSLHNVISKIKKEIY